MRSALAKNPISRIAAEYVISFAAWTLASVAPIVESMSMPEVHTGQYGPVYRIVLHMVFRYWAYALLSVPLYRLSSHFTFGRGRNWRSFLVHLLAFPAFIACYVLIRLATLHVFIAIGEPMPTYLSLLKTSLRYLFAEQLWSFVAIVALAHGMQYYWDSRKRALQESLLRTELAEQQLHALRQQLHPHFLFNTLNGISALMSTDVKVARSMMAQLCDLLRMALEHSEQSEILLRQELEFIQSYLDLQKLRLGDRLQANVHATTEFLDAKVPSMLLQPVVENAVRHGVEKRRAGGTVDVIVGRAGDRLRLEVRNDGPEWRWKPASDRGIGISNTRRRLETLYGDKQSFEINPLDEGGASVVIEIPYVEAVELCRN